MEPGGIAPVPATPRQSRRSPRDRVIRRVQLVLDGRSLDAVMLDVSAQGARVQVNSAADMPPEFLLRSTDGSARRVSLRWNQDGQMGLEFLGDAIRAEDALPRRSRSGYDEALDALRNRPVSEILLILGREQYFGDESLRLAARDMIAALERVERALAGAGRRAAQG